MDGWKFFGAAMLLFVLFNSVANNVANAQFLYGTAGKVNLQTATLENIMLLQNVRDTDYYCPGRQGWFSGWGAGGYGRYESAETLQVRDARYTQNMGGFLMGVDQSLSDSFRAGAFFSYSNTVLDETVGTSFLQDNRHINMHNYFWGGYGRKDLQNFYLLGTLSGGCVRLNESVTYTPPLLLAQRMQTNSWRALVYGEIGKEYRLGQTLFQPFWGLQYFYNGFEEADYHDEDGTLSYQIEEMATNSFRNIVGLRIARDLVKTQTGFLKLDCIGFWYHEYLNNASMGVARIVGSTQSSEAIYTGRDGAILAPTVTWKRGNFRMWAGYILMFNEREAINLGQGGLAYCF